MRNWLRPALAIVAGVLVWLAVATAGNLIIRWLVPGYGEVERAMTFSPGMLLARLAVGAVASLAAGATTFVVARSARAAIYWLAALLLALFVPVHIGLWAKFPVWYHLVFLGTLVPLVALGARLPGSRGEGVA